MVHSLHAMAIQVDSGVDPAGLRDMGHWGTAGTEPKATVHSRAGPTPEYVALHDGVALGELQPS